MFDFTGPRLAISKRLIAECPKVKVVGILHALTDTAEFLAHMVEGGHRVPVIFAKPYSKDAGVIASLERLGIRVEQLDYDILENTSVLRETIVRELRPLDDPLVLIDVGGYFVKPLIELAHEEAKRLPLGVVEVTTFGHNRYSERVGEITVPFEVSA